MKVTINIVHAASIMAVFTFFTDHQRLGLLKRLDEEHLTVIVLIKLRALIALLPCETQALIRLLKGAMYSRCKSIIVYCTRREQTARVAQLIRTQMKDFYGDDSDLSGYSDEEDGEGTPPRNKKGMHTSASYCLLIDVVPRPTQPSILPLSVN